MATSPQTSESATGEMSDKPETFNIKALCMNANGNTEGKGTTEKRRARFKNIVENHSADIIFVQEFSWKAISCDFASYKYMGNNEAGIVFNKDKCEVSPARKSIMYAILEKQGTWPDFDLMERICVGILETKESITPEKRRFLCTSWHGTYKTSEKERQFGLLQKFLEELSYELALPVLIGGDFNLNITDQKIQKLEGFNILEYECRRKRIDYFITHKVERIPDSISVVHLEDEPRLFDHDPLYSSLTIQTNEMMTSAPDDDAKFLLRMIYFYMKQLPEENTLSIPGMNQTDPPIKYDTSEIKKVMKSLRTLFIRNDQNNEEGEMGNTETTPAADDNSANNVN